ncbi:MAG: hypothetical protein ACKOPM_10460, partial [Novosphingobium sp.]
QINPVYYLIDIQKEVADPEYSSRKQSESAKNEDSSVTSEFLLNTLIRQKRLLHRGDLPYYAVSRWRKGVKEAQIAALKALKRRPSAGFIDAVSQELASAASALFGTSTFEAVTNVPCGHSGPRCLAALLAERTAHILGVPYRPVFEGMELSGSSHPKTNSKRPRMRLKDKLECPVLLIDDVATSGSHIAEAARTLKTTAPAVLSMVWIAD